MAGEPLDQPPAKKIRETGGPTTLTIGAIVDGQVLKRVGTTIVSAPAGSSPVTTKGDLFGHSTVDARIPVGADGQVLTADSAQALGLKWAAAAGGGSAVAGTFQARLDTSDGSSANLTLKPYQGKIVEVASELVDVSASFVCAASAHLIDSAGADAGGAPANSTLYYVYVSNSLASFGALGLRLSATAPSLVGKVKYLGTSGNALNWRFVGWVVLVGGNFVSALTSRYIVNYYNRLNLKLLSTPGYVDGAGTVTYTSPFGDFAAVNGGVGSILNFIANGEDSMRAFGSAFAAGISAKTAYSGIVLDGANDPQSIMAVGGGISNGTLVASFEDVPAEGKHYVQFVLTTDAVAGYTVFTQIDKTNFGAAAAHDFPATVFSGTVRG